MSPSPLGRVIERAFASYDAQPGIVQVVTGVLLGITATAASLLVFWLTLQILVDYFR